MGNLKEVAGYPVVGVMAAGDYYIGDPCYAIDENLWQQFCDMILDDDILKNGCIIEFQGHKCFVCATNWGDGAYYDQLGREFGVDAGILGAIPKVLCVRERWQELGHTFVTTEDFSVGADKGRHIEEKSIYFGAVRVKT